MRTSFAATVLAAAVVASAALPAAGASAAKESNAAPVITKVSVPELVGIKASGAAVFTVNISARDNGEVQYLGVNVVEPSGKRGQRFDNVDVDGSGPDKAEVTMVSGFGGAGVWKARVALPAGVPIGNGWTVRVYAQDNKGKGSLNPDKVLAKFGLKIPTKVTGFDAGPERVAKGAAMTVSGRVQRLEVAGWTPHYVPTRVQFRKKGTSTWIAQPITGLKWKQNGTFTASTVARGAGDWRAVLKVTDVTMPAKSGMDYVAAK